MLNRILLSCLSMLMFAAAALTGATAAGESQEAPNEIFDQRLGADDGAAFAILFIANMRGNLGLCDCNHPRGGLARRVGYVEGFKKKFPQTPIIQVDAGHFWYTPSNARLTMLQNQLVAEAFSRFPVDVINLSRSDRIHAETLMKREGLAERTAKLPMISNIISANAVFGAELAAPPPYLIKEVAGPRIKGRNKIRVGFVGLGMPIKAEPGMRDSTMRNPFDTARQIVSQARKECDILVIVAHCQLNAAMRLATENPEADIVIAGDAEGVLKPRLVNKTLVVSAAPGNTQQGDLRVYIEKDGRFRFKVISTELDEFVPSNPAAEEFADKARRDLERLKYGP